VTHPEMRRYFMLISEAVQLVLHAAALGSKGALYVLDMGEQIQLVEMARNLIRLSGFVPDEEIPISFVGLRPGEKLSESLISEDEVIEPSAIAKVLRVRSRAGSAAARITPRLVRDLERHAIRGDAVVALQLIATIVPRFAPAADIWARSHAAAPAATLTFAREVVAS
jgi:FlaA1/EpsC-like NDP-sugar epimerase